MANRMAGKIKDCLRRAKERWARWESTLKVVLKVALLLAVALIFLMLLYTLIFVPSACCSEGGGVHWVCYIFGVNQKDDAIRMLGWGLAGVIAICALVIANRRAEGTMAAAKGTMAAAKGTMAAAKGTMAAAKAQAKTVKVTEAGNRQQRFHDGVSHLGHDKESVRQGGAHALFHLALDDQKRRASIADILCAHIRTITGTDEYQKSHEDKPSTEIQSLLSLLFTSSTKSSAKALDAFWEGLIPDLSGGYFRGAKLLSARFQGGRLEGVKFHRANLFDAQFQGTWLFDAQFQGADLSRAQFHRAELSRAQFHGADLGYAQFHGADFTQVQFHGANLDHAQFHGADLGHAQFQGASLHQAAFQGTEIGYWTFFAGAYSVYMQRNEQFESRIRDGIGKAADFSQVFFTGHMNDKRIEEEVEKFRQAPRATEDDIQAFEKKLRDHADSDTPKNQQRQRDIEKRHKDRKYTKEQAEPWIEEYQKVTASVPQVDDTDG